MLKQIFTGLLALTLHPGAANAQSVDINWMQQAAANCGGGLNIEVRGDLEAALSKKLRLADVESNGVFKQSDVTRLLEQFGAETKQPVYQLYVECMLTIMAVANSTSSLPAREVALTAPVAVAPLDAIRRGDRVAMAPNDVIAVKDFSQIFTVNSIGDDGRPFVYFTWSNSETGGGKSNVYTRQGDTIKLSEKCVVVPYKIDVQNQFISILSNC